jgi:hypothetical protein
VAEHRPAGKKTEKSDTWAWACTVRCSCGAVFVGLSDRKSGAVKSAQAQFGKHRDKAGLRWPVRFPFQVRPP